MEIGSSDSIFKLINQLCQQLCNDYNKKRTYGTKNLGGKTVRVLRKSAFEILLGKSPGKFLDYDPIRELTFHQFDMRISAQTTFDRDRCEELEKCLESLLSGQTSVFRTDHGQAILIFLLSLKNSIVNNAESSVMDLYPFGFYSALQSCSETNPYISISPEMYQIPRRLQVFAENQYRVLNPYMPNPMIFVTPDDPKFQEIDYFFKLNFELPQLKRHTKLNPLLLTPSIDETEEQSFENAESERKILFEPRHSSWTHLGSKTVGYKYSPLFVTEHKESLYHLVSFVKSQQNERFQPPKIVNDCIFLDDIKYLCTGVRSDSFRYNSDLVSFELASPDFTTGYLTPATITEHLKGFLEFGKCFKRLELMTNLNQDTLQLPVPGFVFKALSRAVNKFLFSIRHFIFNQSRKEETLLSFSLRTRKFNEMVCFLARLLQVHSDDDFPHGSLLLAYLYSTLMDEVTKRDRMVFLISILRDCCQAYYQLFDKWMFAGYLIDPYKELFISCSDQYQTRTKYHFDRSFFLQKSEIPLFLRGFEHDLLSCGKYTMLLREYKANHSLLTIQNTPKIRVCLSYEEIDSVKRECRAYLKEAYQICGGKIRVKDLFEELRRKQNDLKTVVGKRFVENLNKWRQQKNLDFEAAQDTKRAQLLALQNQMDEKKSLTLERKKKELELEMDCQEYAQKVEEQELEKIALDRVKRIEYYKELNVMAEEKKRAMDEAVEVLKDKLKRTVDDKDFDNPQEEVCNENYKKAVKELENKNIVESETDRMRNKKRQFGTEMHQLLDENLNQQIVVNVPPTETTEAQKNKLRILTEEFDLTNYEHCDNKAQALQELRRRKSLTDAQKNKTKVLSSEFNNNEPVDEDAIVLIMDEKGMSDRQKNRYSAMSHHLTENYFKEIIPIESLSTNKPMTELERNRLKIMSHEFGINVPVEPQLADQFESETISELQKNRNRILYRSVNLKEDLNLNLENVTDRERNKRKYLELELDHVPKTPSSITPMSIASDVTDSDLKSAQIDTLPSKEDTLQVAEPSHEVIKSFEETPPRKQTYLELIRSIIPCENQGVFDSLSVAENESQLRKKFDLKSLSSLTYENVSMFLQQSLVIPLKTQLELVNNEILKVYLLDLDIYSHFNSLRNYFFLMDGEFGIHICEGLIGKLESGAKPNQLYSYQTLNTILEQAFGASVIGKDKNASHLSFALCKFPETDFDLSSPNVLEHLELVYQVDWPLNLILCQKTIQQYSSIFQYLFKVRRISWILENICYRSLKEDVKTFGNNLLRSTQYKQVQLIRHKLSQFVNCLKNHITSSAIQSSWKRFNDELEKVTSMVDLYTKHTDYIKQIRFLCMLNRQSQDFHNVIEDIFKIILRFNSHLKSKQWTAASSSSDYFVHPNYEKLCKDEQDFDKLCSYVMYLGGKIVKRGYQVELNEFLNLVNVNGFYSSCVVVV